MQPAHLYKQKLSQKTHIKLPYLQRPDKPKPNSSTKDLLIPQKHKQFNLCTSNSKLPAYNPQSDNNLKIFFEKPTNKKLLQRLKQRKLYRKSQYAHYSISDHKRQQITLTPINQTRPLKHPIQQDLIEKKTQPVITKKHSTVTSHQFLKYLENVRKRILRTGGTNTQLANISNTST